MAINAVFPTLSSPADLKAGGFQVEQQKPEGTETAKTQTETAVAPVSETEASPEDGLLSGNREGRGQLVDLKV